MTTTLTLLALMSAWGIYLYFWWRDGRSSSSPSSFGSTGRFATASMGRSRTANRDRGSLSIQRSLSPNQPAMSINLPVRSADLGTPRSAADAARRRTQVVLGLAVAALVTLLGVLTVGNAFLALHLACDVALIGYGYAIAQRRARLAEREIKVQMLTQQRAAVNYREQSEPELAVVGR